MCRVRRRIGVLLRSWVGSRRAVHLLVALVLDVEICGVRRRHIWAWRYQRTCLGSSNRWLDRSRGSLSSQ